MKLTNAQVTRIVEALALAKYYDSYVDPDATYEPQRHRVEMLVDDILKVLGVEMSDQTVQILEYHNNAKTTNHC